MFARAAPIIALAALLCSAALGTASQIEMDGVKQTRYDKNGNLLAVIWAERATVDDNGILLMEQVKSSVHTKDGDTVEIRASKGRTDTEGTGDALFDGDIELASSAFVAKTSRATWQESDNTLRGDDRIALEGQDMKIVGSGFVVFTAENKAVIYKPRGTLRFVKSKTDSRSKSAEDEATPAEDTGKPPESRPDD